MLVAEGASTGVRILVLDDHDVARSGLRWLLARAPWVERCAGAASEEEALLLAGALAFDVALVDVDLGIESGLRACERLQAVAPALRIALLTSRWDEVPMRSARAVGAHGAIAKALPAQALLRSVRAVAAGRACEPAPAAPGEIRFIPREKQILRLAAAGLTNAEIGATLYLAPGTIKHHMLGLYGKLGAPNRAAAVHTALRLGVLAVAEDVHEPADSPPAATGVRVLVADAGDVRRAGMLLALHDRQWIGACAGARSAREALEAVERVRPDVALVDTGALSRALVAARPGLRTLLLRDDEACSHAVLREAGAAGAVLEGWTSERVADAVLRACRGPRAAGGSSVAAGATAPDPVSPRERDVLEAFARGATTRAIAGTLGLSPHTVKQHASSIYRKLGVRNRAEAVHRADELGLL